MQTFSDLIEKVKSCDDEQDLMDLIAGIDIGEWDADSAYLILAALARKAKEIMDDVYDKTEEKSKSLG